MPLVCSFLLRSLPYLLINLQEAVHSMLTQFHCLGKKPKICFWSSFLYAHQEIPEGTTMNISQWQTTVN